jgi:hypothetical protein
MIYIRLINIKEQILILINAQHIWLETPQTFANCKPYVEYHYRVRRCGGVRDTGIGDFSAAELHILL